LVKRREGRVLFWSRGTTPRERMRGPERAGDEDGRFSFRLRKERGRETTYMTISSKGAVGGEESNRGTPEDK